MNDSHWKLREFRTQKTMKKFIDLNKNKIQWIEVFICNGFCVEYRKLRRVY